MTPKWNRLAMGCFFLLGAAGSTGAACDYALDSAKLLQCRPIALLENPPGPPTWTFVDESAPKDNVLAHVLCICEATLKTPDPACEPRFIRKVTFTQPTTDIRDTCSAPLTLCQKPCQMLVDHSL